MPKDKRLDVLLESMNRVSSTPYCIYHHEVGLEHEGRWVCRAPKSLTKGKNPKPTKCFGNIQKCELED